MQTGTVVRVVDFKPQRFDEWDCAVAERKLLATYLGKTGAVEDVTDHDIPVLVRFPEESGVPIDAMRFFLAEVEAV